MRIYSSSYELMSEMGRELNSYGQTVKPKLILQLCSIWLLATYSYFGTAITTGCLFTLKTKHRHHSFLLFYHLSLSNQLAVCRDNSHLPWNHFSAFQQSGFYCIYNSAATRYLHAYNSYTLNLMLLYNCCQFICVIPFI